MKIVIDIPKEIYTGEKTRGLLPTVIDAISNGIPLPEHHGRLIDEQSIIDRFKPVEKYKDWRIGLDGLFNVLSDAPTIIEGSDSE